MGIDTIVIHDTFKKQLIEEVEYYNEINEELGKKFYFLVRNCIDYISSNPFLFPKRYDEIRVCFTKVFPYAIYDIIKDKIYILSIMHTSRKQTFI